MAKGYAEGSALEERLAEYERSKRDKTMPHANLRMGVFGSTTDKPKAHFLGQGPDLRFPRSHCEPGRERWTRHVWSGEDPDPSH